MSKGNFLDAPKLLAAKEASELCGMSTRTWWRKDASGNVPAAITIGASTTKRWRLDEILAWVDADCPPRSEWELRKK